jgi:putative peptidoglycan lipid II flippase
VDLATDTMTLTRASTAVGDSLVVAGWTLVSRISGVGRVIAIAAVLGPTYFGNTYQATNSMPNTVYYGLLGGSLLSSVIVPALVRHIDASDRAASERVAGGVLGTLLLGLVVALPVVYVAAPLLLQAGAAVTAGGATAAAQARVARLLLLMLLPQVFLYAVVGSSSAVMHSRRRFALAAAAPAVENLGCIATLVGVGVVWGTRATVGGVPTGEVVALGLGTTGAVAAHAALQWWGARRAGVVVRPRAGWRDPEVVRTVRHASPALAQAALEGVQLLTVLFIANTVAGGVVAFQVATNFFFLPIALGATPVALSLLPRLSRLRTAGDVHDTLVRGLRFAAFVAFPSAAATVALAPVLARAISVGRMGTGAGEGLVEASLVGLGVGIAGEALFLVGTYASYATGDLLLPLRCMVVKLAVCAAVVATALAVHGTAVVLVTGLGMSAGAVVAAARLVGAVVRRTDGAERVAEPLTRIATTSVALAIPLWALGRLALHVDGHVAAGVAAAVLVVVAAAGYLAGHRALRSPEVAWLAEAVPHRTREEAP